MERFEGKGQTWHRSSWARRQYKLGEDGFIRPIPESPVEFYEPFREYAHREERATRSPKEKWSKSAGISPHADLAGLDTSNVEDIEAFASRWGLLGLFQHHLVQARYVPTRRGRVQPLHDPPHWLEEVVEGPGFRYVSHELDMSDDISAYAEANCIDEEELDARSDLEDQVIEQWRTGDTSFSGDDARWREDPTRSGQVIVSELDKYGWEGSKHSADTGSLRRYFERFFPDPVINESPDAGEVRGATYPAVNSPQIFDELCEHVSDFSAATEAYRTAREELSAIPDDWRIRHKIVSPEDIIGDHLSPHIERIRPCARWNRDTGTWEQDWMFPSLLSTAYYMLLLDLTKGHQLRYCANSKCRNAINTDNPARKYCCRSCKEAQKQRRLGRSKKTGGEPS